MLIEVSPDKSLIPILEKGYKVQDTKVYIFADIKSKTLYLSNGENAAVSTQFNGLQEIKRLSGQLDFDYEVVKNKTQKSKFTRLVNAYFKKKTLKIQENFKNYLTQDKEVSQKTTAHSGSEVLEVSNSLDRPFKGGIKDYVITMNGVFAVAGTKTKKVSVPENGEFYMPNYKSRAVIQDGKVVAIELWREDK